jgi:exopolysaccharide biosynthesis WecB/TagA/CpsF family protein
MTPATAHTVEIADLKIHNVSRTEFFEQFNEGVVVPINVDLIMQTRRDPGIRALYASAEWRICDSQIVLLASRFLGTPFKEKISGSDALGELCVYHRDDPDFRLFLLGARPGIAAEAGKRINARIGREIVVGSHSPSFSVVDSPAEQKEIVDVITSSGATVLAVGLGAPKQERVIMALRTQLPATVRRYIAIGATLDFEAGNIPRAPAWMSRSGLEWAFRLFREPGRLWRRYLLEDTPFLWLMLCQRLGWLKRTSLRD